MKGRSNTPEAAAGLDAAARQPIDLQAARASGTIDVEAFGAIVEGSAANLARHKLFTKIISDDKAFEKTSRNHFSRQESFLNSMRICKKLVEMIVKHKIKEEDLLRFVSYSDEPNPLYLQLGMFSVAIKTQTDDEQFKQWYDDVSKFRVLGCYAQTELGHGSGISNLETTATFDRKTDEFVIHSPTLSSAKFWPGGLAKFSNHAIVYAQLIIDGKSYGPHGFITQTRSFEDHREMKGVTLRDIGPKVGYAGMDNGYAKFDHVRVPRRNMLMRFAKVSRDGKYIKPPHSKLGYAIMTESRVEIVDSAWRALSRALVIAIRYCLVRRQSPQRSLEPQVIDYALVQYRLFPLLTKTFALNASYVWLKDLYDEMMQRQDFSLLAEVHAMSSSLKAYSTEVAANGIEEARRCLGGQGYLQASGIPDYFNSFIGALAFEGENGLLTQQTARYLLKQIDGALTPGRSTLYLVQPNYQLPTCKDAPALHELIALLGSRVLYQLKHIQAKVQASSWSSLNVECARISKAQAEYTCLLMMVTRAMHLEKEGVSAADMKLYRLLALIYGLSCVDQESGDFLESKCLSPNQIGLLRSSLQQSFLQLRPEVALLVDSFHLSDSFLASALGSSDGRVYERLVQSVMENPLNAPPEGEVVLGYNEYIRPLVHGHHLSSNHKL
ncbi:hypothetical protein DSO57_1007088 [Entomophthora muscae]|uniref:Uncharacterized protein n=2 Tax=Entomophthora muscae TaxID=34485 RepID=A0ACC2TVI9_9FUNG|nr:hypothetical protein DSO57_1007088 [Entomophthora muscae]